MEAETQITVVDPQSLPVEAQVAFTENAKKSRGDVPPPRFYLTLGELGEVLGLTPNGVSLIAQKHEVKSFRVANRSAFSSEGVRKILEARGYKYTPQILSFQMLKGGSTKTSSAFNLAVRLHEYGAKVLCVDLDMQGNLTDALDVDADDLPVFYHVAAGEVKLDDVIVKVSENIDLIPSGFENSTLDFLINKERKNLSTFISAYLAPLRTKYDYIIIDCNPALSPLNISIALASDKLIIPVNPDKFSAKGLVKTLDEAKRISGDYMKDIKYNLLFTLFDGREGASQRYLIHYGNTYPDKLISTVIRRNSDVKNAIDQKKSIFDFPKASAREDFDLFTREIMGLPKAAPRGNA